MRTLCLWLCLVSLALPSDAEDHGRYDRYTWRLGFLVAQGHYQVTLKWTFDYRVGDDGFDPAAVALPQDDNLHRYKLLFKVDGDKVEPMAHRQVTWWSQGSPVQTWIPEKEGKRVTGEALYIIKNLFLIPPAPTNLPLEVDTLESGFAPIPGFELTGSFIGETHRLTSRKIAGRPGEPTHVYGIRLRRVPASAERGLLFLIPKSFTFSFNNLRAAQWDPVGATAAPTSIGSILGGTGGQNAGTAGAGNQDTAAGHKGFSITGDLKAYSAVFYKGNPARDWVYALTWLQQERTYLPFGIQPGGAVKSRTLFAGAGDHPHDLIPWLDPKAAARGDAVQEAAPEPAESVEEVNDQLAALEQFLTDFRAGLKLDPDLSRMIAYTGKRGMSPAYANRALANAVAQRFGLTTAPVLTSRHPRERVAALPLAAFEGVVTGLKVGKNWFFVDAANPTWTMERSMLFLQGRTVVILEEGNVQMGAF